MKNFCKIIILLLIFIYKDCFGNQNQDRIFKYLQNFNTLKSEFIQVNNNGDVLSGEIFIVRPGKVRIKYNEIPLLIISDGKKVATINKKLKSITFYKLSDIPVSLLLFKNFRYDKINILEIRKNDNQLVVKINEKKKNASSYVEVLFEETPFQMKKWTVFRDKNTKTEVLLNNLELDRKIVLKLFDISIEDPRPKVLPK
tara:strand:+ start:412 stop:1008 length:597 start_codon:yes stop_codon:yes gene_type:complete